MHTTDHKLKCSDKSPHLCLMGIPSTPFPPMHSTAPPWQSQSRAAVTARLSPYSLSFLLRIALPRSHSGWRWARAKKKEPRPVWPGFCVSGYV